LNPIARRLQFESSATFKLNPNQRKSGFEGNQAAKKVHGDPVILDNSTAA
jgi:hypothetical protein